MNVDIDPSAKVRSLSPAKKQLVEIAKVISTNAKILIMDEPSAPLSASEVETMFRIVAQVQTGWHHNHLYFPPHRGALPHLGPRDRHARRAIC